MASTKIVLYKSKTKDNKNLVALRVTHHRKLSYLFFDWVAPKDWDEKTMKVKSSHPNSKKFNYHVLKKYTEANDLIFDNETKKKSFTAKEIVDAIKVGKKENSFFKVADEHLAELLAKGNIDQLKPDKSHVKKLREYLKESDIAFHEITQPFIRKFFTHLMSPSLTRKGVSHTTAMNALVVIRTIYNRAIADGIADQKDYPFGKGKFQIKYHPKSKIGLNEEELKRIERLDLEEGTTIWHTRNVFMFSFYLAGVRISDVLHMKWAEIQNDRLIYSMNKNKKTDSLKLPGKVKTILTNYEKGKDHPSGLIFPELKKADLSCPIDINRKIRTAVKKFNTHLKKIAYLAEIDKKITNHISRHTFGNIAGDKISPQMLQKLYRHSHLSTTIGYQGNFIHKDADDALDSVLDF